jgi:hypothetical protein
MAITKADLDPDYVTAIRDRGLDNPEDRALLCDRMLAEGMRLSDVEERCREQLEGRVDGSIVRSVPIAAVRQELVDARQTFDYFLNRAEELLREHGPTEQEVAEIVREFHAGGEKD